MSPRTTGATRTNDATQVDVLAAPLLLRMRSMDVRECRRHSRIGPCRPPGAIQGGIAQLVERQLCKLEVTGSSPVASTNATGRVAQLVRARP